MDYVLRLRTGPVILVAILRQFHSPVSQSAISESVPPVARYRLNGCSSMVIQDEVCPFSLNSASGPSL